MLMEFSVKNFRNFKDRFTLNLVSEKSYEFNPEAIFKNEKTIKTSMIYGHNGEGKSNLGLAILDLTSHLNDSHTLPNLKHNYLNADSDKKHAEFEYIFKFSGAIVKYKYMKTDYSTPIYEELTIDNHVCAYIDKRSSDEAVFSLEGAEHLKTNLSKSKISIIKYLNSNSVLNENYENSVFKEFISFVDSMLFFRTLTRTAEYTGQALGSKKLSEEIIKSNKVKDFENFLNDAGIKCKLIVSSYKDEKTIEFVFGSKSIEFSQVASSGTMSLGIFYYWWIKLESNSIKFAFIDEFDAFYHYDLSKLIVQKITKSNCQCILTTHNTSLFTNDLLRPDCYFTIQNQSISPIYEHSDRELRKAHNLEKMYRTGAFND